MAILTMLESANGPIQDVVHKNNGSMWQTSGHVGRLDGKRGRVK